VSVDKALARDRELRVHATSRPWHQDGPGSRFRLVGPLPRSTVVVDPYAPNPQDAPLILHRINTYEELDAEIERLRAVLREAQAELEASRQRSSELPAAEILESLTNDLRARIGSALGDRRAARPQPAGRTDLDGRAAKLPGART
jgi:hypothetical protein